MADWRTALDTKREKKSYAVDFAKINYEAAKAKIEVLERQVEALTEIIDENQVRFERALKELYDKFEQQTEINAYLVAALEQK